MSHNITVEGGKTVRLPTAGKYCDRDIVVTAEGGAEDLDAVLTEQTGLIDELKSVLSGKAVGGGGTDNPNYKAALKYIESTGTQYIDTGITLTDKHSVEIDYQITEQMQYRAGIFGGLATGATARYGTILSPTNACLEYGYGAGNVYYQTGVPDTARHLVKQAQREVYVDNVLIYTFPAATFSVGKSAPLGSFDYTNYKPAKAKYFGSKWWDGDVLVRDFVPVLDWDDRPCMYDNVSGQFFYNKGTGEFQYENPVPEGYIKPSGELEITENGTHDVAEYASVNVNVPTGGGEDNFVNFLHRTATEFESEEITTVSQYICYNYTSLKSIDFPNLATIGGYAFYGCTGLTSISTQALKSIGTYAFYNCAAWVTADFPEVTTIGSYAFRQCRKLTEVRFPKLTSVATYALSRCSALTKADLGLAASVTANLFAEDSKLTALILRKSDDIATLAATSALSGTAIASGTGYIYVPTALLDSYKEATNWSTYAAQFRAIEDYPGICGVSA